jgi:acyl transferase domain-containing protein
VAGLPTYPFQRRRFWIDEPRASSFDAAAPAAFPAALPAASTAIGVEAISAFLHAELAAALKADELDLAASFADLGGDSFTAMLFVKGVEDRYGSSDVQAAFAVDRPLIELLAELAAGIAAGATVGSDR